MRAVRSNHAAADASPAAFELIPDDIGRLTLRRPGEEDAADVRVRAAFPWTRPGGMISLRSAEGKELMLIEDLSTLGPETRRHIEQWQRRFSFVPTIRRVEQVDSRFGYQLWTVQTDRGPAHFRVQEREDVRFLPGGRFNVKDADGNVYALPGLRELDPGSRKAVEGVL